MFCQSILGQGKKKAENLFLLFFKLKKKTLIISLVLQALLTAWVVYDPMTSYTNRSGSSANILVEDWPYIFCTNIMVYFGIAPVSCIRKMSTTTLSYFEYDDKDD